MPVRAIILAGLALVLSACGGTSTPAADPGQPTLAGSSWVLQSVVIDGTATGAVDDSASLTFSGDGSIAGSTGCNRFFGSWSLADGRLAISPTGQTMMACPGEREAQERAVLAALEAVDRYTVSDAVLTLGNAETEALLQYRAAPATLSGSSWRVTGVNTGGAVEATALTEQLTLQLGEDGSLRGFAGCTELTGRYEAVGTAFEARDLATAPGCADAEREALQNQYLAALSAATTFRIDGSVLELRDESGALQVGLVAAP